MATFQEGLESLEKKLKTLHLPERDQNQINEAIRKVQNYMKDRAAYCKEGEYGTESWQIVGAERRAELLKTQAELMEVLTSLPERFDGEVDRLGGLLLKDMRAILPKKDLPNKNMVGMVDTKGLGKNSFYHLRCATIDYYGRKVRQITRSFPKIMGPYKDAAEFRESLLPELIDDSPWRMAAVNGCINLAFTKDLSDVMVGNGMRGRSLKLARFFATADRETCANLVRACTVLGDDLVSLPTFEYAVFSLSFGARGFDIEKDQKKGWRNLAGLAGLKFHVYTLFPAFLDLTVSDYLAIPGEYFYKKRQQARTSPYGLLVHLSVWDSLRKKVAQWSVENAIPEESPCHTHFAKLLQDMKSLKEAQKPLMEHFEKVPVWLRGRKDHHPSVSQKELNVSRAELMKIVELNKVLAADVTDLIEALDQDKMLPLDKKAEISAVLSDIDRLAKFGSKLTRTEENRLNRLDLDDSKMKDGDGGYYDDDEYYDDGYDDEQYDEQYDGNRQEHNYYEEYDGDRRDDRVGYHKKRYNGYDRHGYSGNRQDYGRYKGYHHYDDRHNDRYGDDSERDERPNRERSRNQEWERGSRRGRQPGSFQRGYGRGNRGYRSDRYDKRPTDVPRQTEEVKEGQLNPSALSYYPQNLRGQANLELGNLFSRYHHENLTTSRFTGFFQNGMQDASNGKDNSSKMSR